VQHEVRNPGDETGGEDFAYVRITGEEVLFILADDPAIGQLLVTGLTG